MQLRNERGHRGWSQADMAKMLSDKGIPMHATTIAKIEAGDRAVKIEEAAGIADLLGVSLDRLLGRDLPPEGDLNFVLRDLRRVAQQAASHVNDTAAALRDRTTELTAFEFEDRDSLVADVSAAHEALRLANAALRKLFELKTSDDIHDALPLVMEEFISRIVE